MPASNDKCSWFLDRIELYVDDELVGEELAPFEGHAGSCAACRDELSLATAVVGELRAMPQQRCPDHVVEEAAARAGAGDAERNSLMNRLVGWLGGRGDHALRPAMAVMLVVIVAATIFVMSRHEQSPFNGATDTEYTEQEVELAKIEAQMAFAYLGRYSRRTGEIIKKDVIQDRVLKPLGKTVVDPMYPFPRDE
jgi:anti-sigma factor RsiW